MTFSELRLAEPIVRAVADQGYDTPTPIQAKAIPVILSGRDVLGCAQTGTGKTGAFAMPMLHALAAGNRPHRPASTTKPSRRGRRPAAKPCVPRALVISPTRELASQIYESFRTYGSNLQLRHVVIFGGVSQTGQMRAMRGGADVIVATPGRLLDLMRQGLIDTSAIEVLVLDEADHMLDMGFIPDIRRVIEQIPKKRQTLFFSATMPRDIRKLAEEILTDPVSIAVDPVASTVDLVDQSVYMISHKLKPVLLERLVGRLKMSRTLVFTRTKRGADKLVQKLQSCGLEAGAIHGNKSQNARTLALAGFKSGKMPILVATDIAARGIDVANVSHVVNFDIPHICETYVHRIGRTARAGAEGMAISLCDRDERGSLRSIERLIDQPLHVMLCDRDLEDHQASPRKAPRPSGRGQHGGRGGSKKQSRRPTFEGRTFDGREQDTRSSRKPNNRDDARADRTPGEREPRGDAPSGEQDNRRRGKKKPYWQDRRDQSGAAPKQHQTRPERTRHQQTETESTEGRPRRVVDTITPKKKSGGKRRTTWVPKGSNAENGQSNQNGRPAQKSKSGGYKGRKSKPHTNTGWKPTSKREGGATAGKKQRSRQPA